ncbi:hypothetical protein D3C76_389940 [compost metagenome]
MLGANRDLEAGCSFALALGLQGLHRLGTFHPHRQVDLHALQGEPLGGNQREQRNTHDMTIVNGDVDHLGLHRCAEVLHVAVEELVEQIDVLLCDQTVGCRCGFLQATGDFTQINGCHGGG